MQNVDYSRRIRRPAHEPNDTSSGGGLLAGGPDSSRAKSRLYALAVGLSLLTFAGGIVLGLQLGRVRSMESGILKNPDRPKSEQKTPGDGPTFSDPGQSTEHGPARFLVRVGSFPGVQAEKLANRLNNIPELAGLKPEACSDVKESVPGRYAAFRTRVSDASGRQNVLVGCFTSEDKARDALGIILSSNIPESTSSRIFEIE